MRLVHAADLHLDSPLRGLSRLGDDATAAELRSATRKALINLVDLVIAERVPVLLLAGDVYDGDWHDYSTGGFFVEQMDRLVATGVRVFVVSGNHDAASEITRALRLPAGVTLLDTSQPQRVVLEDLGLAIHGQGFASRAVAQNLAAAYPHRLPGMINIGLLHTSVDGTEGHGRYAPCSLSDLTGLGYDYFALGHVHRYEMLATGQHTVAYSGNLQGRHPGETGPKGALLVDLDERTGAAVEFRELDVARWAVVEVPTGECRHLDDVMAETERCLRSEAAAAGDRPVVARVKLTGRTSAAADLADTPRAQEEIHRVARRVGVTVEKISVQVVPPAQIGPVDDDLLAAVRAHSQAWTDDPDRIRAALRPLDAEIGRDLREAGLLDLSDRNTLSALARQAVLSLEAILDSEVSACD